MITAEQLKMMAAEAGFDACLIIPAEWEEDCPDGMKTLVLLLKRYQGERLPEGASAHIHPYYFASQQAYRGAKHLVESLKEMGENTIQDLNLKLIPLCSHLNCFKLGKNSLLYYADWGSRFHIQVIALQNKLACDQSIYRIESVIDACKGCTRCQAACPAKSIGDAGVNGSLCLREHMLSGKGTPEKYRSLMKNRLVGCDNCQAACPMNEKPDTPSTRSAVELASLLPPSKEVLDQLTEQIGSNLAIRNRICAQACIIAGNSGDAIYLDKLEGLAKHPSSMVAEAAKWALKCINETLE